MRLPPQQGSSHVRNWTPRSVVATMLALSILIKCKASSLPPTTNSAAINNSNRNSTTVTNASNVTGNGNNKQVHPILFEDVLEFDKADGKQEMRELSPGGEGDDGGWGWQFEEYPIDEVHPGPPNLECYTCHYSKWRRHEQGMSNCDDPFDPKGIPTVICEGLCAKTKTVMDDGEYMIMRSCLPNCRDVSDARTSVECCFGTKCNGSHVAVLLIAANVTVCAIVFMLGILFICSL